MPNRLWGSAAIFVFSACVSLDTSNSTSEPSSDAEVIAAVEAAERARIVAANAGDIEKASGYVDSEFFFVHSTGQVDDLEKFRSFAERAGRRPESRQLTDPIYSIIGNTVVRTRFTSTPPRPGLPDARYRSLDVFIQKNGVWKWLAHQSSLIRPPWAEVSVAPVLLEEYAGTYVHDAGQRSYSLENGKLIQAPQRVGESAPVLTAISESTFALGDGSTTVTFLRDQSGRVAIAQIAGPFGITVYRRNAGER